MLNILKNGKKEEKYIKNDINTLMNYFIKSKSLESKKEARKKLLLYKLKELALKSKSSDIKKVQYILDRKKDETTLKESLIYLNDLRDIKNSNLIDIKIYKAYLYEILNIEIGATQEYKELIELKKSKEIFNLYHDFIVRTIIMNSINSS